MSEVKIIFHIFTTSRLLCPENMEIDLNELVKYYCVIDLIYVKFWSKAIVWLFKQGFPLICWDLNLTSVLKGVVNIMASFGLVNFYLTAAINHQTTSLPLLSYVWVWALLMKVNLERRFGCMKSIMSYFHLYLVLFRQQTVQ